MAITLAPGTGCPCAPVTTPLMLPVVTPCADNATGNAIVHNARTARTAIHVLRPEFIFTLQKVRSELVENIRPGGNGRVTEVETKDEVR
jgi:hypothetical protein